MGNENQLPTVSRTLSRSGDHILKNDLMMIKIKLLLKIIIFVVILPLSVLFAFGSQENPDAWEKHQDSYQPVDKVIRAIGIKPGMIIGEIGAGRGRYAVKLARNVGRQGKIYANDIIAEKLAYLEFRCIRDNIKNLKTVLGKETDPGFNLNSLDMIFMVNTYHHIRYPMILLRNSLKYLKKTGVLVILECDPIKHPDWGGSHSTAKEMLVKQVSESGYKLLKIETFLPKDNIYIFTLKRTGDNPAG